MLKSIEKQILNKIRKARGGSLFFIKDFTTKANNDAVRKALERLVKSGKLQRSAAGIYFRPAKDPIIGTLTPEIGTIAKAIARRDHARIVPTGTYALNQLGLSTQVPLNVVYLTDGAARKIKIGNRTITFKKTAPKNLAAIGEIDRLVVQALRTIGKDKVASEEIEKLQQLLKKEKLSCLQHDIKTAPEWIRKIMLPILKQKTNE